MQIAVEVACEGRRETHTIRSRSSSLFQQWSEVPWPLHCKLSLDLNAALLNNHHHYALLCASLLYAFDETLQD